ncbi:MAG TPA: hypothetical protein VFZ12_09645, partial [Dehalococcoidia bacterium]|nr:hypothetical protein [Dehalococcoidia bacterium]
EIVFEVVRLQLEQPQQVVLLFVRPEDDGYVAGHLEPAFCQGALECPPPAGATVEIVVKETCVNARQEPSRLGPINRCLRAGERYFLTGESEEADGRLWVELLDAGWVSASYIRCVEACGEAAIPLPCSGGPCPPPVGAVMEVTIQSGCLNARVAPGLESEATSCLPDGHTGVAMTFETALAGGFQWIFLHNAGWVAANYTRCVRECGGTS